MNILRNHKKICMILLVICLLVLMGVILGVVMREHKDKTETKQDDLEQEIVVHESDDDAIEKNAEGGLTESDSEDGPVLNENNMIDFNGSDAKTDHTAESNKSENTSNGNATSDNGVNTNDSTDKKPEEKSKDTGSWGAFY